MQIGSNKSLSGEVRPEGVVANDKMRVSARLPDKTTFQTKIGSSGSMKVPLSSKMPEGRMLDSKERLNNPDWSEEKNRLYGSSRNPMPEGRMLDSEEQLFNPDWSRKTNQKYGRIDQGGVTPVDSNKWITNESVERVLDKNSPPVLFVDLESEIL